MAAIPYMPFYIADYLADCSHLTTLEHGAYLLLIMNYWQRGRVLPASDDRLANIARLSSEDWAMVRPALSEFFEQSASDWKHKRIEIELSKFRNKTEQAKAAGKASAERKLNGSSTAVQRTSNENIQKSDKPVERTFNHTDTDTDTDLERTKSKATPSSKSTTVPNRKKPVPTTLTPEQQVWFDRTWPFYWKRVSKAEAKEAYGKCVTTLELADKIHAAVLYQSPFMLQREIDRQPHFASWLNGERWEDEYGSPISQQPAVKRIIATADMF